MTGALAGTLIIEAGGIGPVPFCGMMLADHGATVVRLMRPGELYNKADPLLRSKKLLTADLKSEQCVARVVELCGRAEGLVEGFRPGVMERLGLGPDVVMRRNRRLVYGRMTGWGQTGPMSAMPGHDINYISLSGALCSIGRADDRPVPPLNLLADFGGGGMLLAFAMVAAILSALKTGDGQSVDCAMTEGASLLMAMIHGIRNDGRWVGKRESNNVDGGAPYYDVYECADGRFVAVGAIEPEFYERLLKLLGISADSLFDKQSERGRWPAMKQRMRMLFLTRPRASWCELLEGADCCFTPVLSLEEAPSHPHNVARGGFVQCGGGLQPSPAPRFDRTAACVPQEPVEIDFGGLESVIGAL